ncbi:hypothetical protein [Flavobacterium odoriferum]|uniref:hypothetical protein n=1 Tax=Flavobacterium odoriferum TaxID=2946604 RepID=UPI0021CB4402|nr:hypothetical protein [Flavobacterium sp. HXWNR29]
MAGKVVNSSFLLLSKFGASRQESTSKTATSHIRKPLYVIMKEEIQTEKLVKKFNIEKESLTEESILKDFQEDIKNLPNEYRS